MRSWRFRSAAVHVVARIPRLRPTANLLTGLAARSLAVGLPVGWLLGLVGCGNITPVAPYQQITDPAQLFMSLTVDHPAVNLSTAAPYDTLQLTATPRNALGEPMAELPAPVFHLDQAADSLQVTVTPTGLLTAKDQTGSPVLVLAEIVTGDNVRRTDSTYVTVTTNPTPPVLASLSIDAMAPDSAVWPIALRGGDGQVVPLPWLLFGGILGFDRLFGPVVSPHALDTQDNPIDGLAVEYRSLDPTIAEVDRWGGDATPIQPGQVRVVAQTTAYGVTKVDTAAFTVTWSFDQVVSVTAAGDLLPSEIRIAPYGLVFWLNSVDGADVSVTFDDPTNVARPPDALCTFLEVGSGFGAPHAAGACGTGDFLVPVPPNQNNENSGVRARQFPTSGVYTYHTSGGRTGRIFVSND